MRQANLGQNRQINGNYASFGHVVVVAALLHRDPEVVHLLLLRAIHVLAPLA